MHPLHNGSQAPIKPNVKSPIGIPGFFTEGGYGLAPSYPGADYFNAQISEFQTLLAAAGIEFDLAKVDHLTRAIQCIANKEAQFAPWSAERTYKTGETCTVIVEGELKAMQMYAGPNLTSINHNPAAIENGHLGWQNPSAPFWWIEYKAEIVGMPFYWLSTTAPTWAVMEINVNLPVVVYWRLAQRYPSLVINGFINTGDIRGEFIRIVDQSRGVDIGREINSYQSQMVISHVHTLIARDTPSPAGGGLAEGTGPGDSLNSTSAFGGNETRPRNIARAMAIAI